MAIAFAPAVTGSKISWFAAPSILMLAAAPLCRRKIA
jgi:hypothetical protein